MIEAFRLGAFVRGRTLWDGLDFAFEDGNAWLVVGPPACGKTLLFSILRGERRPDAGDVLVSGESLYRGSESAASSFRASGGCVPERLDVDPRLTVYGLFRRSELMCGDLSADERKERRDRLLSMVGLADAGDARFSTLSASERARAALAAELLRKPKILFADGVVQAAGMPFVEMLGGLFRAMAGAGSTLLLAERQLPASWAAFAGRGRPVGPFLVYRLTRVAPKGGSG
ncbi:MAG: ectoine/hydroxyectoine transporter ATP-binding protein EhuA [Deltaproteobacteria bacterium]|nr:ectoine/hydroxyectoine transporter ATP-binding protein EhuA [Deltaproteobacteria bacterium]